MTAWALCIGQGRGDIAEHKEQSPVPVLEVWSSAAADFVEEDFSLVGIMGWARDESLPVMAVSSLFTAVTALASSFVSPCGEIRKVALSVKSALTCFSVDLGGTKGVIINDAVLSGYFVIAGSML